MSAHGAPAPDPDDREWQGDYVRYDLVKEFVVALAVITALTVVLAVLFSSPDDQADHDPELGPGRPGRLRGHGGHRARRDERGRHLRPALQRHPWCWPEGPRGPTQTLAGSALSGSTRRSDFVLDPLHSIPGNVRLKRALAAYQAAPPSLQSRWTNAYTAGLEKARYPGGLPVLPPGRMGPSPR